MVCNTQTCYYYAHACCAVQVKHFFRPEFLNRLDDIVVFDPLSSAQLLGVAKLMAEELNSRLAPKNITLKCTDAALHFAVSQVTTQTASAFPFFESAAHHVLSN